jgi:hypothetical protein
MTWKHTAWVLQWGSPAGVVRTTRVVPPGGLTFHFPPGTPLWALVKGEIFLRGGWTTPVGGSRRGRWSTRVVRPDPPGRWATTGVVHPGGVSWGARSVGEIYRPGGFDFGRWRFRLRGGSRPGWSTLVDPEGQLRRPRYA